MNWFRVKMVLLALAAFLVAIQFFQPQRTNPPTVPSRQVWAHVQVPPEAQNVLKRACSDCHSNQTVWPWYSRVAPISWVVVDDVNAGRRHVNFDDWEAQVSAKEANDPPDRHLQGGEDQGHAPLLVPNQTPGVSAETKGDRCSVFLVRVLWSFGFTGQTEPRSIISPPRVPTRNNAELLVKSFSYFHEFPQIAIDRKF